jgi:RNase H-like domain found in reverse transcriptase/Integrase zinc binding domain/Chromo (CHRromatin Organisation MOdifier) domain
MLECTHALDKLIKIITSNPILQQPNYEKAFTLEVDALQYAMGVILYQENDNRRLCPVGYHSHTLNPTEQGYNVHNQELLAVMRGLCQWRHLFLSSPYTTTVIMDHANLQYYQQPQKINQCVACYLGDLANYDFKLVHKPGKLNKADHLSQWPDYNEGKGDNENVLVLPDTLFTRVLLMMDIEQQVYDLQGERASKIQGWVTTALLTSVNHHWFHGSRPVVAGEPELWRAILQLYHDHGVVGHPGITNMYKVVAKEYWWPDLKCFVVQYIKGCAVCQSTKPNMVRPRVPLFLIGADTPVKPFHTISWDLIMDLPTSQGYDTVLTIADQGCTKAVIFIPCSKEIDAEGVATLYAQKVFPHYGVPQKIISNCDPCFTAKFAWAICTWLNITQNISTAYHPQMDGQSKQANAWVEQYICIYGNAEQEDWASLLPLAQYIHNLWENASMGYTLFELLIGHTPTIYLSHEVTNVPEVEKWKEWLEHARHRAQAAIKSAQKVLIKRSERKKGQQHYLGYQKGDQVWLEGMNLKLTHLKAKLDAKRYGPFTITKVISPVVFQLELPLQWKIHNVFHASLLTPYKEMEEYGRNFMQPVPELVEGEEECEVEQVMSSRQWGWGKKLQYLLWWKGYSCAYNSWQDATDMHAPELIKDYHQRKLSRVRAMNIRMMKMPEEEPSLHPSMSHAAEKIQTPSDPSLAVPACDKRVHTGTLPISLHDNSVIYLLDLSYCIEVAYCDNSWFIQQGWQPFSSSLGRLAGPSVTLFSLLYDMTQAWTADYYLSCMIQWQSMTQHDS